MNRGSYSDNLRKMVKTGLLIALAVVVRNLSYMVYYGGATGMRIGFSTIFTNLAAILFGPVYGGIASGSVDVIGYIMKAQVPYIPLITVTAVLGGIITALVWKLISRYNVLVVRKFLFYFFMLTGLVGIINYIFVIYLPLSVWTRTINSIGKLSGILSIGLILLCLAGISLLLIDYFVRKRNAKVKDYYLKTLLATGTAGLIVTILNTYILRITYTALGNLGFIAFLVPRVIEELFMITIQAYIISLLITFVKENLQNQTK